jgi:hypothetical protein
MKKIKEVNMVEVLSLNVWIWNIDARSSHVKKESCRGGRIMEGVNQTRGYNRRI